LERLEKVVDLKRMTPATERDANESKDSRRTAAAPVGALAKDEVSEKPGRRVYQTHQNQNKKSNPWREISSSGLINLTAGNCL
jgi:hypothetical protein